MTQIIVEIKDNKVPFFMELLKSFDFVKKSNIEITDKHNLKSDILSGLKESVEEVKLIRAGKLKGINAKDLLNEL
ncbi:MAG: hypothetical protein ACKOX3_06830 [Bacteroidota bacterium]